MGAEFDPKTVFATKTDFKNIDRKITELDHKVRGENASNLSTFENIKHTLDNNDVNCAECRKTLIKYINTENNRVYTWVNIVAVSICIFCIIFTVIVFIAAAYH